MIRSCWSWWRWRLRELLTHYGFPGDEIPIVRGRRKPALEQPAEDPAAKQVHRGAAGRGGQLHPGAGPRGGQAVPDGGRRRVLDRRPRHRGHRAYRARDGQDRRRSRDHRLHREAAQGDLHRRGNVQQDARSGSGRRQRRLLAPRHQARGNRARPGAGQAGLDHAAHEVRGRSVRACRRRKAAGTRRSSAAIVRSSTSARPT